MGKYIEYHYHESGVHEYVWLASNREVIDEHLPMMKQMNEAATSGDTICVLHDLTQSGAPPFLLLSKRKGEAGTRDDVRYHVAYISDTGTRLLMQNFAAAGGFKSNRKFFDVGEREQAINWLVNED